MNPNITQNCFIQKDLGMYHPVSFSQVSHDMTLLYIVQHFT